jgi:excisionase family DNA binding protein
MLTGTFTKHGLACFLKCSARHVQKLVSEKKIRHFIIGKKDLRFTTDAVEEFIRGSEKQEQEGEIGGK